MLFRSSKEVDDLFKKHYGKGFDDDVTGSDDEEDSSREIERKIRKHKMKKIKGHEDDELDFEDEEEEEDETPKKKYVLKKDSDKEEMEEGFDSSEMKRFRREKDYSEKEFEDFPVGRGDAYFDEELQDDQTGISFDRFSKRYRRDDNDNDGSE